MKTPTNKKNKKQYAWKIVSTVGLQFYSISTMETRRVCYKLNEWTYPPLNTNPTHPFLFVFKTLRHAKAYAYQWFKDDKQRKYFPIFRCEVKDIFDNYYVLPSGVIIYTDMFPNGTQFASAVKLIKRKT